MTNLFFIVTGYKSNTPFISKFTLSELEQNKGSHADTEMFHTLQGLTENELDAIVRSTSAPVFIPITRDGRQKAMIMRVPEHIYIKTKEQ